MSSASPERTRKPSWSASQWYIAIGWPGARTKMFAPTWGLSSSTSSVTNPRGPQSLHFMSRTLRTYQLMRGTLGAQAVEHYGEMAAPLPGGSIRQRGTDEKPDVLGLHVSPHRAGALGAANDPIRELLELGGAGLVPAVNNAAVQPGGAHVELRDPPDEVEERLPRIVRVEGLLRERAHLCDVPLDDRVHEVVLGREAAEDRSVADPRQAGDLVDARIGARRAEGVLRRVEHQLEISPRIGAQLGHPLANTGWSSVRASASMRATSRLRSSATKTMRLRVTRTAAPPKAHCQPCTIEGSDDGLNGSASAAWLVWLTATVVRIASPSAPPTCCDVLKSPDASP